MFKSCFFTLSLVLSLTFLIVKTSHHLGDTSDLQHSTQWDESLKIFQMEMALHSQSLEIVYTKGKGIHSRVKNGCDLGIGATAMEIPCSYMLSFCK